MIGKKVVLLTVSLAQGGAETVVAQLALALQAAGWRASVVSMLPPTAFVDELTLGGVPVISLNMRPGHLNLAGLVRLYKYLRDHRPDLVHSHMFHANIVARLIRFFFGIPVVSTIHSEVESSHRNTSARGRELTYRLTNKIRGRITAVSESIRERYGRLKIIPGDRIAVIRNGVDLDRFHPSPNARARTRSDLGWNDAFVWLAVGRLELAKDYPTLIQAFRKVHTQAPTCRLVIAGDGRLKAQLEHQIQNASLGSTVSLFGSRTDIPELMNACDALVVSSAWEGGPLVLIEAAATGRPVVSTNVGFAASAVLPGKTGFLIVPGAPDAMADAMLELMALPETQLTAMGEAARQHVEERFSLEAVHSRYQQLYEEVLA